MSTQIRLKRSTTTGVAPANTDLEVGELAINTADRKLFSKHSNNTVIELGSGTVTSVAIANNTGIEFAGSPITGAGTITPTLSANLQSWHAQTPSSYVLTTRTLSAGNGLTGGGDLSANRTFTLGTPSELSPTATNAVTTASHTHAINMIDATNRLSTDLASVYPSKGPIVGDAGTASGDFTINGTLLTARINDNRTFQIYAQIAGGTATPEYYARSSHTSTGGGGWTALQRLWHSGNQLALGTTATTARSALGLGTAATQNVEAFAPVSHTHAISDILTLEAQLASLNSMAAGAYTYTDENALLKNPDGTTISVTTDIGVVDNTLAVGLRSLPNTSSPGAPTTNRFHYAHWRRATGGGEAQLGVDEVTGSTWSRARVTGAWTTWRELASLNLAGTFTGNQTFSGAFVVTTGGYLINRRVIPRVYLESPNQTNGYYIDANVSDSVFGGFRIIRRDNATVLFELNNAAQLSALNTITTTGAITAGGNVTGVTQTRVQNAGNTHSLRMEIGGDNSKNLLAAGGVAPLYVGNAFGVTDQPVYIYNNNAVRLTVTAAGEINSGARYMANIASAGWAHLANFSGSSSGGIWADSASQVRFVNAAFTAGMELTSDLTRVYGQVTLTDNKRMSFRPDALVGHTTDLPNNIVANLSANYHNNNLLGVSSAAGVYHASDAGFTWYFKSSATWRQVMNILIGGTGASVFSVDGTVSDVAGNVRDVPPILRNSTTAFALSDRGRYIYKNNTTAYTWAVNTSVWVEGMTVSISNRGTAGDVTISRGSGMVLRSGATDVASFALTPGQTRTLLAVSATEVHIL